MATGSAIVPSESSVLCEGCGYTLDGLPETGRCPECGLEIAQSRADDGRGLPAWEMNETGAFSGFIRTTGEILARPKRFYRTLATRRQDQRAARFAFIHWSLSAILIGLAAAIHVRWMLGVVSGPSSAAWVWVWPIGTLASFLFMWGTTRLAARLSAWEAAYRGIRLPLPVVLRGLYYHAAHVLPVALGMLLITHGNWLLLKTGVIEWTSGPRYLFVLCIAILLGAGYLFHTYWVGMRGMMYANR